MKEAEAQSALIPRTNVGVEFSEEEMEELMAELTRPSKVSMWLERMGAKREKNILDLWLERLETEDPAIIFPRRT